MISVIVGCERADNLHVIVGRDLQQIIDVVGRVDNDGLARLGIADQITEVAHLAGDLIVLGKVTAGKQLAEVHV